jgi:hypothetical protein
MIGFETAARAPLGVVRQGIQFGREVVGQTVGLVFPAQTQFEFARQLASEQLLERMDKAKTLIEDNQDTDVSAIPEVGYQEVAEIVLEAVRSEKIPRDVRDQTVDVAAELGLDPSRIPSLAEPDAARLENLIEVHDKVRDFPVTE